MVSTGFRDLLTVLRPKNLSLPLIVAILAVGLALGGLLIGYEPVGGDPDTMYRPIKSELARSLKAGTLPFWSDRFGLGVPLVAESHVAAFYPPNWLFYRAFDLITAFRLRAQSQDSLPDLVSWRGDSYLVQTIEDYTNYGRGFVQAYCTSEDLQDAAPQ